jgi:molybdate transport system ATP-binding protein
VEADAMGTLVETAAGPLIVPGDLAPGIELRLRIRATDVTLATARPEGLSEPNVVRTRIAGIERGMGGEVLISLRVGEATILAQAGRGAIASLGLAPGSEVWAVLRIAGTVRWLPGISSS